MAVTKSAALDYHSQGRPGKLKIVATKSMQTQTDLSLAYSPGVAYPVLEIADRPEDAYEYTAKGNLVAVISNGTAILGLGNRGAQAAKPVMEGKAVLFKSLYGYKKQRLNLGRPFFNGKRRSSACPPPAEARGLGAPRRSDYPPPPEFPQPHSPGM